MNYYNDNDKFICKWLQNLIDAKLIPEGKVDDRSITDIKPNDLKGFRQCHFFAGIAGWSYALRLAGWPEDREVWTGSPPCQNNSNAGAIWGVRTGLRGKRSGLAHCWLDLVGKIRPTTLFFENVPGISAWIAEIKGRLEGFGYQVSESKKSAGDIGAPHLRRRLWLVADRNGQGLEESRKSGTRQIVGGPWRTTPGNPGLSRDASGRWLAHGIPGRMDQVRAFGNSIVPQVAAEFIRAYLDTGPTID